MKILVTGAAGFIGQHLCRELADHGHEVGRVDWKLVPLDDLRRPPVIAHYLDDQRPDMVVHLAARVGRVFGEDAPAATVESNAGMTTIIAKACGERGVRLVYASTSEVYGDQGDALCDESSPLRLPHNIYGLSKRWGEEACRLYAEDPILLRLSMPYGPGLPPGRGRAAIVNMLWQAQHRMEIPVHEGAERSWCWIGDTVRGIRLILERGQGGAWNVGRSDSAVAMVTVAEIACDISGADDGLIRLVEAPARQTLVKRLDTRKLQEVGWAPTVGLVEGMRRLAEWTARFDEHARFRP